MIDKVVRMRGQHGRFGIDHSELLNYELEQTNKARDDYMNLLVYKSESMKTSSARCDPVSAPVDASVSQILMNRLQVKDDERFSLSAASSRKNIDVDLTSQGEVHCNLRRHGGNGLSY